MSNSPPGASLGDSCSVMLRDTAGEVVSEGVGCRSLSTHSSPKVHRSSLPNSGQHEPLPSQQFWHSLRPSKTYAPNFPHSSQTASGSNAACAFSLRADFCSSFTTLHARTIRPAAQSRRTFILPPGRVGLILQVMTLNIQRRSSPAAAPVLARVHLRAAAHPQPSPSPRNTARSQPPAKCAEPGFWRVWANGAGGRRAQ